MADPTEAALAWLHDQGLAEARRAGDDIEHPEVHVRVIEGRVGPAYVQEAFAQGAVQRKPALVLSTRGFTEGASRWARRAGVGLVILAGQRGVVDANARAIFLEHVTSEGEWSWRRLVRTLQQLPRAGSIEGRRPDHAGPWAITRLRWQRYELRTPDGRITRGPALAVLDVLRGSEPLDLDDYEITVIDW